MPQAKPKHKLNYRLKRYLSILVPSYLALAVIAALSLLITILDILKNTQFINAAAKHLADLLSNSIINHMVLFVLWGLFGFLLYFIAFESLRTGEEIEFEIREVFSVKWPKGKNPVGPLENTLIRLVFRIIVAFLLVVFSIKALLIINHDFKLGAGLPAVSLIFFEGILLGYVELILIRLVMLKNRVFNLVH